jgi:hypothetical protein
MLLPTAGRRIVAHRLTTQVWLSFVSVGARGRQISTTIYQPLKLTDESQKHVACIARTCEPKSCRRDVGVPCDRGNDSQRQRRERKKPRLVLQGLPRPMCVLFWGVGHAKQSDRERRGKHQNWSRSVRKSSGRVATSIRREHPVRYPTERAGVGTGRVIFRTSE